MLSVAQLKLVIFCIVCFSTPVRSLLAPKPKFDSLQHRNIIRMKDSRMAVDIAIPSETFSVSAPKVNEKALISSIITASYMSIIVSVMALPVCLAAMSADLPFYGATTSTSYLSELISVATVAIVSSYITFYMFYHFFFFPFNSPESANYKLGELSMTVLFSRFGVSFLYYALLRVFGIFSFNPKSISYHVIYVIILCYIRSYHFMLYYTIMNNLMLYFISAVYQKHNMQN